MAYPPSKKYLQHTERAQELIWKNVWDDGYDVFAHGGKNLARLVVQADEVWLFRHMLTLQFAHWCGELAVLSLLVLRVYARTPRHVWVCHLSAEFGPADSARPQVHGLLGSSNHMFVPWFMFLIEAFQKITNLTTRRIRRQVCSSQGEVGLLPYDLPSELEESIRVFVGYYNYQRYHQ